MNNLGRRRKIIKVAERSVIDVFTNWKKMNSITLPYFVNIPEDAILTSVRHDPHMGNFSFEFIHPSFSPVPFGLEPEILHPAMRYVTFKDKEEVENDGN